MKIIYISILLLVSCGARHEIKEVSNRIRYNQVGYHPDAHKSALVVTDKQLDFELQESESRHTIFSGRSSKVFHNEWTDEKTATLDFSKVKREGVYILKVNGIGSSASITIKKNPYRSLLLGLLKGFYYQRSSDLTGEFAGRWKRKGLVTKKCIVWRSKKERDCQGGWFDAGDYGRYAVPAAVSAALLIYSYENYPQLFDDELGIPESGNGVADILDEAHVGIKFLAKLQDNDGGVFHKVTSKRFNYMFVAPHRAIKKIYFMPKSLTATLDFAAVMARASTVYRNRGYLKMAKRAWDWALKNKKKPPFKNPEGVKTGEYKNSRRGDEWLWAATELYLVTSESGYFEVIKKYSKSEGYGFGWFHVGSLARLVASKDSKIRKLFNKVNPSWNEKQSLFTKKESIVWGSNGHIVRDASEAIIDGGFDKKRTQLVLDYILGRNGVGKCFVTGFGFNRVMKHHHRPSTSDLVDEPIPGLMVGGANQKLEGLIAADNLQSKPILKRYIDHFGSYSTNETAIDMNAALIFFVSALSGS